MPSVESIQYARDIVEKIIKIGNVTNIALYCCPSGLGGLTLSIIK